MDGGRGGRHKSGEEGDKDGGRVDGTEEKGKGGRGEEEGKGEGRKGGGNHLLLLAGRIARH
jgi:hypothetical protein